MLATATAARVTFFAGFWPCFHRLVLSRTAQGSPQSRLHQGIRLLMATPLRQTNPFLPSTHRSPLPPSFTPIVALISPPCETSTKPLEPSAATETLAMPTL